MWVGLQLGAEDHLYTKGGGDWYQWQDQSPFLDQRQGHGHEGSSGQMAKTEVPGERKLKMTQVIDQSDDGEYVVQSEEVRAKWYQHYLQTTENFRPRKRTKHQNR